MRRCTRAGIGPIPALMETETLTIVQASPLASTLTSPHWEKHDDTVRETSESRKLEHTRRLDHARRLSTPEYELDQMARGRTLERKRARGVDRGGLKLMGFRLLPVRRHSQ